MKEIIICVSGGFDPPHGGHIDLFREARKAAYADRLEKNEKGMCIYRLVVLLNSDEWLTKKKGKPFMEFEERAKIVSAFSWVDRVTSVWDKDGTVCEGLRQLWPHYFANGGDRGEENTPELQLCKELGIIPLFNVGGAKTQSSSTLLKEWAS